MPEQTHIFRDRYEVTEDDLNGLQADLVDALDNVVADTLTSANKYEGFGVTEQTSTSVLVGTGRIYYGGKRYFNNTAGGIVFSLSSFMPITTSRKVAIVLVPNDQQTDLEERDYEVDATTETYEPQSVAILQQRWAVVQGAPGGESVVPLQPPSPSVGVVVAWVTLTTAGITAIAQNTDLQVPNLDDVEERTETLETQMAGALPRINTIADDLARLQAKLDGLVDQTLFVSLAQDVARLKAKANLPATYVNYREDDFLIFDATVDDPTYSGYSALIQEGLRFDADAIGAAQLQVLNPYDPLAKVSGGGILLPAYTPTFQRIVADGSGTVSLTQYAYQTGVSLVQATMSATRVRYGAQFEAAANSSFFAGGNYVGNNNGVFATFQKDGQSFQVYDTAQVNPDGQEIYRVANYWYDTVSQPYWSRVTVNGNANGYPWAQTFVQAQSGWCIGMTPRIALKPTSGTITFGLCGVDDGEPDLTNILGQTTLNAADVVAIAHVGEWLVPLEPIFLQAGQRYAYFVITGAAYVHECGDIQNNAGGTCFYMIDGGVWYPSPSINLTFDLAFASFKQTQTTINLSPLSLSGGIAAIDMIVNAIVPANTVLKYEILPQGTSVWQTLGQIDVSALASLPPLCQFRATFVGTAYLQPGLTLSGSQVKVSRPKTAFKHGTKPETLATPATKISSKTTLIDFDPAHHTYGTKVLAAGTLRTPDTSTDVVIDARTIERTQTFSLPAAVASYVSEQSGNTDSAARLFHAASVFEFAGA